MAIQTEKFGFVVRNQSTGEKLSGALVELRENSNNYVLTEVGTSGFYQIASIPTGKYEVYVDSVNSNATMAVGAGQIAALGNILDNVPISTTDAYEFKTPDGLKLVLDLDQVANVAIPIPTGADTNKIIVVDSAGDYQLVDASSADDQLVKVSSADTTSGYLDGKLIAGTNITLTKGNVGADETLEISSTGATIPTPALDGSFLVKNTNGTFTLLDGVSGPPMRWDSPNSRFLWTGQIEFTGAFNYNNGSIVNFLDALGVQDAFIANQSGGAFQISSSALGGGSKDLEIIAGADIILQTSSGKVDVQNDIEVAGDTTLTNLPTGTQVGLVGYDSAGKLIQGASSGGTQDLDSVLTQGNSSSQNINLTSGASANVDGNIAVGSGFVDHYINFRPGNAGGAFIGLDVDNSTSGSYIIQTGSSKAFAIKTNQTTTAFGITAGDEDFGIDTSGNATFKNNLQVIGNLDFGGKVKLNAYTNSSPSLAEVWSDGQELRGYQRGNQDNDAFDQNMVGASVSLLTSQDVNKCPFGFSQIANSTATNLPNGWETSGVSNVVTFGHEPNSTTISQIISSNNRVAQRSTRTGAWTELSLRVEASTNPSTMAVDSSLYKQISANNLAQTCTIPLPTNGVDGSKVIYRFRAVATSTLSWNAGFNDLKGALPTSVAINKSLYVGVIYDAFTSTWDVVSVVEQN